MIVFSLRKDLSWNWLLRNLNAKSFSLKFRNNPFFFPLFPLSLFLVKTGKKLENSRVLIPFRFIFFFLIENEWRTRRSRRKLVDSSFISSLLRSSERKKENRRNHSFYFSWSSPYLPSSFFISYSLHFRKKWGNEKKKHSLILLLFPLLFFLWRTGDEGKSAFRLFSSPSPTFQKMKGISHYFFFTFSCLFLL